MKKFLVCYGILLEFSKNMMALVWGKKI
ncbi:hypothetical protein Gotur_028661 [Gossypium turneri]